MNALLLSGFALCAVITGLSAVGVLRLNSIVNEQYEVNRKLNNEVVYLNLENAKAEKQYKENMFQGNTYYRVLVKDQQDTLAKVDEANQQLITKLAKAGMDNVLLEEHVENLTAKLNHKKMKKKQKKSQQH